MYDFLRVIPSTEMSFVEWCCWGDNDGCFFEINVFGRWFCKENFLKGNADSILISFWGGGGFQISISFFTFLFNFCVFRREIRFCGFFVSCCALLEPVQNDCNFLCWNSECFQSNSDGEIFQIYSFLSIWKNWTSSWKN